MKSSGIRFRPVSIKDVARELGISHSTVSRALQGSPLLNPVTVEQVRQKAQEMGYRASAVARSLVNRRTETIGVVVTSISDPFNGEVVSGIEEAANSRGYSVILATSQTDPEREIQVVRSFQERRVDGILVASSRVGALYVPLMTEMGVPIVLINNQHPGEFVFSITIDNVEATRNATRHLIELGHTRIAYLGDRFGYQSDTDRRAGYQQALEEAGLRDSDHLVEDGTGGAEGAVEPARKLLDSPFKPTAIVCYNDMTCLGVLRVAGEMGISVPGQLSLVGIDDLFFTPYLTPPLTTVRQPRREMGVQAMELLFALLANEQNLQQTVTVQGELIVRSSTSRQTIA